MGKPLTCCDVPPLSKKQQNLFFAYSGNEMMAAHNGLMVKKQENQHIGR